MKNLKRIFSLALAGTMLAGMLTVGASAADFTDADEIVNANAVDTMVALNIINGKDDGSFDPTATVTRAEMAKMITVALNGGVDPVLGTKTQATYTDIKGHWAEKYIEYCSNLGIIGGRGDGTFDPNGTVTGTEAAKMVLVAMGYDSTVYTFTGADWATNVNIEANNATPYKLYEDIETIDPSVGLTRDNAAQIIFNGIQDDMMGKSASLTITNGEISYNYQKQEGKSILTEKYGAQIFIGTFTGNKKTGAANTEEGEILVVGNLENTTKTTDTNAHFPSDLDLFANIGEEVKVIFKDGNGGRKGEPDSKDTIYGVFNTGTTTVYTGTMNDVADAKDSTKLKINGTKYDAAAKIEMIFNFNSSDSKSKKEATPAQVQAATLFAKGDTVKFVCNEKGEIFKAYIVEYDLARVLNITASKITLSGVGAIDIEDNDIAEDLKKDDVVVYTRFYSATDRDEALFTVNKAESVEGEITGYKKDGDSLTNYINVVVDGTTYKVDNKTLIAVTDDAVTQLETSTGNTIGDTVRVYLVNGMAKAVQSIEEAAGSYALIVDHDTNGILGSNLSGWQLTIMDTEGVENTYTVHKDSLKIASGANDDAKMLDLKGKIANGVMIDYTVSGKTLKIREIFTPKTFAGNWDQTTKKLTYATNKSAVAATGAVLFVDVDDNYYVYTLRDLGDSPMTAVEVELNDNGLVTAAVAKMNKRPAGASADTVYGIIASYEGTRRVDNTTYYRYSIGTADGEMIVNITADDIDAAEGVEKPGDLVGKIVSYQETSNNQYAWDNFDEIAPTEADEDGEQWIVAAAENSLRGDTLSYFTGMIKDEANKQWKGTATAKEAGETYSLRADTVTVAADVEYIYVDKNSNEYGADTGVVAFDPLTGYANILFHINNKGVVDIIVVETSTEKSLATTGFGTGAITDDGK